MSRCLLRNDCVNANREVSSVNSGQLSDCKRLILVQTVLEHLPSLNCGPTTSEDQPNRYRLTTIVNFRFALSSSFPMKNSLEIRFDFDDEVWEQLQLFRFK